MSKTDPMTRRRFLATTSTALVGAAAAASAASRGTRPAATRPPARLGANEKLVFGVIGVGGMGSGHVRDLLAMGETENVEIAAVCDVYRRRVHANARRARCKAYYDYRRLLDEPAIDAVVIATPDHWHFRNAADALDAGKHVYLQKPMVHTLEQIFKLRDKARRKRELVVQVGAQGTGNWRWWAAHEQISRGLIGDVLWSQASVARNSRDGEWNYPINPNAGPHATGDDYIDWDMWLGHAFGCAPKIPWNPEHFFRFRKYRAYSGGIPTDLFYHRLAPLLLAIEGPSGAHPRRVSAAGGIYVQKDGREVPDTSVITIDYPGEHTVVLTGSMANATAPPDAIRGQYGTIVGDRVTMEKDWADEFHALSGGRDTVTLTPPADWNEDRRGGGNKGHMLNFIDVIRGRQKQLNCPVELAAATQLGITLGVLAYDRRQTLLWDTLSRTAKTAC